MTGIWKRTFICLTWKNGCTLNFRTKFPYRGENVRARKISDSKKRIFPLFKKINNKKIDQFFFFSFLLFIFFLISSLFSSSLTITSSPSFLSPLVSLCPSANYHRKPSLNPVVPPLGVYMKPEYSSNPLNQPNKNRKNWRKCNSNNPSTILNRPIKVQLGYGLKNSNPSNPQPDRT